MSERRPRNWWKISCIGCFAAPCLVLLLSIGVVKCQISKIGNQLPDEVAKLRAMGVATEPEDLRPSPPIPASENAATLYNQIFNLKKRIAASGKSSDASMLVSYTGHPNDVAAYEAAMMRYEPVFDLASGLPKFAKYAPDRKYEDGFDLLFPEFSEMKDLVKRESARTRYLLEKGRKREALAALDVQFAVADHLAQEPTLIGALVCIAIHAIASVNLDMVLEAIQDDLVLLAEAESLLVRHNRLPSFRTVMEGELVLGRISLRKIRSWSDAQGELFGNTEPNPLEKALDNVTLGDPSVRRMFEAKHVQAYRELFQSLPKNEQDLPAMSAAMKKFTAQIENDDTLANKLNQLLFPVFAQAEAAFAKMQAEKRVSLLAVKLLRMRPEGLPADLSKFGALAIDPLTGKSMLYVRKGGGFKVWSVGGDLNDNGGRKRGTGVNYKDTDIVLGYRIGFPPPTKKPVNLPPGSPSAMPGVVGP